MSLHCRSLFLEQRGAGLFFNLLQPARPPETNSTPPPRQTEGRQPVREGGRSPGEEWSPEQCRGRNPSPVTITP